MTNERAEAIREELRRLAVTREHIDWLGDLLQGAYAPAVGASLAEHLREEEERHHAGLGGLLSAVADEPGGLAACLEEERFHLHLLVDHLEVAGQLLEGNVAPAQRAKLVPHVLEEERVHLRILGRAEEALRQAAGTSPPPPTRSQLTVGSLFGVPQSPAKPR